MKIYLSAIPLNSGSGAVNGSKRGGDVLGVALAEDGAGLGSHLSSSADFAKHDMGLTSNWKHDTYAKHYPDGFELEWVNVEDIDSHAGWQAAKILNDEKHATEELATAGETGSR